MTERKSVILDVKASEDGGFNGVLSTYGNVDLVGDVCDPHCFDLSVKERGTKRTLLWQHDQGEPIGSFHVTDTVNHLAVEGRFNLNVQRGREAHALLKAGDVGGLSIGYRVKDYYHQDGVRHLKDVDLMEGSFVTFPANPLAYAEAKNMETENKVALRKQISGLDGFKSLSATTQECVMRAINAAIDGEQAGMQGDGDITITEQTDVKALVVEIEKLVENAKKLSETVKEVKT